MTLTDREQWGWLNSIEIPGHTRGGDLEDEVVQTVTLSWKGDLPVSLSWRKPLQVDGEVEGGMCLRLGERALGWVCSKLGSYAWCCPDLWSVFSKHAKSSEKKQIKQNLAKALTFRGLNFIICGRKTLNKIKCPWSWRWVREPLTHVCKTVLLSRFASVAENSL